MLVEMLPWLERLPRQLVVVKYGGHAMVDDELRRASPRTSWSCGAPGCASVVVHGGGPQISSMLDRLGLVVGVPRRAAGDHAGDDGGGPHGAQRPGRPRARRAAERARSASPSGISGEDAGLLSARRRGAARRRDGGRRRARRRRRGGRPDRGPGPARRRPHPRRLDRRAGRRTAWTATCSTSTPTPPPRRWPSRWTRTKLVVLTDVEGLYTDWPDDPVPVTEVDRRRCSTRCFPPWRTAWCPRWRPACVPSAAASDGPTSWTGGSRTPLLLEVFTTEGVGTMVLP